ncbi:MAG: DUF4124 domain-containing protein [Nitrospinales bacterium]
MRIIIFKLIFISVFVGMNLIGMDSINAEVYKWVDKNGKSHYTDSPSKIPRQYRENNSVNTLAPEDEGGGFTKKSMESKTQKKPITKTQKIKYKKAEKSFSQLVKADPDNPRGYIRRGHVRNLMGNTQSGKIDLNKGMKLIYTILSRHPNDCTAYQMMAEAYLYMKKYNKSITAIQKAIKISPQIKVYRRDLQAIRKEMQRVNS